MKKYLAFLVIVLSILLVFTSCDLIFGPTETPDQEQNQEQNHEHAFGEWEIKTPATCTSVALEHRVCSCGEEEFRQGIETVAHDMVGASDETNHWLTCSYGCGTVTGIEPHSVFAIEATCNKTDYVVGDTVSAADLTVSSVCQCGAKLADVDGITLENATLANAGENTVTVKLGDLYVDIVVNASKLNVVLNGSIVEDTYVFTNAKDSSYIDKETMGTHSSSFRVFLKYNLSDILANEQFIANMDDAKVQFTFTIVEGAYTENTTFSFGGFIPGEGVSDFDFANITWNAVRNTPLDWANAVYMFDQAVGSHHVSFDETTLTITVTYGQIKDFIDADGNAIFTLRAKESGVKISSKEGVAAPTISVIINDEHLHAFDQKIADEKYLISSNCGEQNYYYKSCRCGETNGDYFKHGDVNGHSFGEWEITTPATCTEAGLKTRTCTTCSGETIATETEVIEALGHSYESSVTAPTCTEAGYTTYTCACGDSYTSDEVAATGHSYESSVTDPTCTEAGATVYTCACGHSYSEEIAATGHKYEKSVTEPTCTEAGATVYTCACGHSYSEEIAPKGHSFVEGKCECGAEDPNYVAPPVAPGGSADFGSIVLPSNKQTGDSSYTASYTTANGWVTNYSAIQCGGSTNMNPQFTVIGSDTTYKAVCLNGKTSAPGSITSPILGGGMNTLTVKYTKMFTDTALSATVTITDLTTGAVYTHVIAQTLDKNDKYTVYTDVWTLDVAIEGNFTIAIVNNCPTGQDGNKDRMTILDITWTLEENTTPDHTHSYEASVTEPTCTEAGATVYTCSCGDSYSEQIAATGHKYEASVTEPTCTEAGATVYTCSCGDSYSEEIAASGHKYGEWEVAHPATCEGNEILVHTCSCGHSETSEGQAAFGHDVQTKYDENNHWTECARNCGLNTEPVAHFGGEATTTEQAICEGCGQPYGELKVEEEKDVVINGTIVQDTYITSDSSSGNKNFADRAEINCNNGKNFRPIFEFNLADALNHEGLQANKENAKVQFTFVVSTGTADLFDADGAKFSIYGFLPGTGVSDVDYTVLTWNSCKDTGANSQFYRKDTNSNFSVIILNETKDVASAYYTLTEVDGVLYITYTLDYTAIEHLICTTEGADYGDIAMGFDFNQSIKFASMESTKYAAPAVQVTYTK